MGQRLGAYELEGELGRGAFGRVFRARHLPTGAARAVKVLESAPDPETLDRFRREAAALARLGGKGVVPVHELGEESGRVFIAMELMRGRTLKDLIHERGKLAPQEAALLVAKIGRTVERAHALGLVHRDLKPANVLFDDRDEPRVADFGCVRDLGATRLTATGAVLGTPAYAAPEQLDGAPVGPPADVFALGVVLHELLTGRRPFEGRSLLAMLLAARAGKRTPTTSEGAPPALEALVARALDPRPEARPTAGELALGLEGLASPGRTAKGASASKARTALVLAASLVLLGGAAAVSVVATRAKHPVDATPAPPPPASAIESAKPDRPATLPSPDAVACAASVTSFVARLVSKGEGASSPASELGHEAVSIQERLVRLQRQGDAGYAGAVAPLASAGRFLATVSLLGRYVLPGMTKEERQVRRRLLLDALANHASHGPVAIAATEKLMKLLEGAAPDSDEPSAIALMAQDPLYGASFLRDALERRLSELLAKEGPRSDEVLVELSSGLGRVVDVARREARLGVPEELSLEAPSDVSWARFLAYRALMDLGKVEEMFADHGRTDDDKHLLLAAGAFEDAIGISELIHAVNPRDAARAGVRDLFEVFRRAEKDPDTALLGRAEALTRHVAPPHLRDVVRAESARLRGHEDIARALAMKWVDDVDPDRQQTPLCARAVVFLVARTPRERAAAWKRFKDLSSSEDPWVIGWHRGDLELVNRFPPMPRLP
jgi:hypothetical protein